MTKIAHLACVCAFYWKRSYEIFVCFDCKLLIFRAHISRIGYFPRNFLERKKTDERIKLYSTFVTDHSKRRNERIEYATITKCFIFFVRSTLISMVHKISICEHILCRIGNGIVNMSSTFRCMRVYRMDKCQRNHK